MRDAFESSNHHSASVSVAKRAAGIINATHLVPGILSQRTIVESGRGTCKQIQLCIYEELTWLTCFSFLTTTPYSLPNTTGWT